MKNDELLPTTYVQRKSFQITGRLQVSNASPILRWKKFLILPRTAVDVDSDDIRLLIRTKGSDKEAFRVLFDRYQPVIFRRVLFSVHETDLAHDIVQETFVRIWSHRSTLRPGLSFLAYAMRVSGNLVRDEARRRGVRERAGPIVARVSSSEPDNPEETAGYAMLQKKLSEIVDHYLPTRCRLIFLLSRFEGKSNADIARELHISVRTVEHQMSKALAILRKRLRQYR